MPGDVVKWLLADNDHMVLPRLRIIGSCEHGEDVGRSKHVPAHLEGVIVVEVIRAGAAG